MDTVTLEVEEVKHETDLAFLFLIDGDDVWVPKSQIDPDDLDEIEVGDEVIEVNVSEWFCEKEGLV